MNCLTFLTLEQLFGPNKLDIINKIGTSAAITDFSILLGGDGGREYHRRFTKERKTAGMYWTKTATTRKNLTNKIVNEAFAVNCNGDLYRYHVNSRQVGTRIVLPYSSINRICSNKIRDTNGVLEVECGEYPQWAPSSDYQLQLETAYQNESITKLKDYIRTDSRRYHDEDNCFKEQNHQIYEYRGKKYIRLKANTIRPIISPYTQYYHVILSNGEKYAVSDYVWVEISPVKWLIDEKENIALSKNILFAGVQFQNEQDYKGDFSKTDINWFMNTYLIKDLFQNNIIVQSTNNINELTREQLLEEIKLLRTQLQEAIKRNINLTKENNSNKQKIKKIQDITEENNSYTSKITNSYKQRIRRIHDITKE